MLYASWEHVVGEDRNDDARETNQEIIDFLNERSRIPSADQYTLGKAQMNIAESYGAEDDTANEHQYLSDAVISFERFLNAYPDDEDAQILLSSVLVDRAEVLGELGRIGEGNADWNRAIQLAPVIVKPELLLRRAAWLYRHSGESINSPAQTRHCFVIAFDHIEYGVGLRQCFAYADIKEYTGEASATHLEFNFRRITRQCLACLRSYYAKTVCAVWNHALHIFGKSKLASQILSDDATTTWLPS